MASSRTNKNRKLQARSPYRMMLRSAPIELDEAQIRRVIAEVYEGGAGLLDLEAHLALGTCTLPELFGVLRAQRQAVVRRAPQLLPPFAWRQLALVPPADFTLSMLGAGWPEAQVSDGDDAWATSLRDGIDQFAGILWMLRSELTVGAVVSARHFLERWTFNVASSHMLEAKAATESDQDYVSRVWSVYSFPDARDPGVDWAWLSELLHGRVVAIGKSHVSLDQEGFSRLRIHSEIVRIIEYPMMQIRGAIRTLANDHGIAAVDQHLSVSSRSLRLPPFDEPAEIASFIGPADFINTRRSDGLRARTLSAEYRDHMLHQSTDDAYVDGLLPSEGLAALVERVGRRFENAEISFAAERDLLGDEFQFGHLAARLFRYYSIAYMAELVSLDENEPGGDALRLAGLALNSAWEIWLEDSDLSLPTVRVIVEQTAIARVHRTKPQAAIKLARSGASNGPSRWIEAAGWGRLSAYIRALGEFSHVSHRTRSRGARCTRP